jgi:polyisoprenoid-binding protein YceI
MNRIIFPIAIVTTLILSAFTTFISINWKIAEGYSIKFIGEHPSGVFTSFKGVIQFDENNLETSKFDVSIDVASINTGNGIRNKHAKDEKWFDVKNYPEIKFTSSSITKTSSGYLANGTLQMHGVQKQISIPFTFSNNIFNGSFNVNRLDYKIGTIKGMSARASTDYKVEISVPVTK